MNIIVCIKEVPETTEVRIDPKTNTLVRESVKGIINPFDMYAVEEGLRIKERVGGKVTVLTMGPPQADGSLREAISLGVDEAVLISDRAFAGSDTWATSYTLAKGIDKIGLYDLIICGKQAIDGDTAQVGPGISVHLNIPLVSYVKKVEEVREGYLKLESMTEEGYEVIEANTPCLITVVKEINTPRLPSLKGKMRATKQEIIKWKASDLNVRPENIGLNGSPTQVVRIFTPPQRAMGEILTGNDGEVVDRLAGILKDIVVK